MRESFVFHAEYLEDLPEEYKSTFLMYIYNYGIHGEIPHLSGLENSVWIKIQRRIDDDIEAYERKVANLKQYRNRTVTDKNTSENIGDRTDTESVPNGDRTSGVYVSDSVSVYDNVSDHDDGDVSDSVSDCQKTDKNTTTSLSVPALYSKTVFNIFKEADFPCANGNEISFLQTDFKNGLAYIHNAPELAGIHSDDVIQACKNYVTLYKDERAFIKHKINFYSLVKSKLFYNLLPQNFDLDNYLDTSQKDIPKVQTIPKIKYDTCPKCKGKGLFWADKLQKYSCNLCGVSLSFEEVNDLGATG